MAYRCVSLSIEGLVQQVAVNYIVWGYYLYVTGRIPSGRDTKAIDEKIISNYGIAVSQWTRARRKRAGFANLQYIRFEDFYLILATEGRHRFFEAEARAIRDVREVPIKFAGYALSFRGGHSHVRIEQQTFNDIKAYFLEHATRRTKEALEVSFYKLPFEPYAPIRSQFFLLLRKVNKQRKAAGLPQLSTECLRLQRRIYRPFDSPTPRVWGSSCRLEEKA